MKCSLIWAVNVKCSFLQDVRNNFHLMGHFLPPCGPPLVPVIMRSRYTHFNNLMGNSEIQQLKNYNIIFPAYFLNLTEKSQDGIGQQMQVSLQITNSVLICRTRYEDRTAGWEKIEASEKSGLEHPQWD